MSEIRYLADIYEKSRKEVLNLYGRDAVPRFKPWHVEVLIEQISSLLSRCVQNRNEYFVTLHAWKALEDEIDKEELEQRLSLAVVAATRADAAAAASEAAARNEDTPEKGAAVGVHGSGFRGWHARLIQSRQDDFGRNQGSHAVEAALTEAKLSGHTNYIAGHAATARSGALNSLASALGTRNDEEGARLRSKKRLLEVGNDECLHFDTRCKTLASRIQKDFGEAISRAIPASTGLTTYFDYKERSLEDRLTKTTQVEISNGWNAIDELLSWTREVEAFLAGFDVATQRFTVVYSLSASPDWDSALARAKASGTMGLFFKIPDVKLSHHCLIGLEGTGAHVNVKLDTYRIWSAILCVPQDALIFDEEMNKREVGQQQVPRVFLGRITTRSAQSQSEVVGGISTMNASPIPSDPLKGWHIEISPPEGASDFDNLVNLDIEFHFAGLPLR